MNETLEFGEHVAIDQRRLIVFRPAMDDAVPHGIGFDGLLATQPLGGGLKRRWHIGNVFWRKCLVDEGSAIGTGGTERRLRPDAVHLPLDVSSETAGRGIDGNTSNDAQGSPH